MRLHCYAGIVDLRREIGRFGLGKYERTQAAGRNGGGGTTSDGSGILRDCVHHGAGSRTIDRSRFPPLGESAAGLSLESELLAVLGGDTKAPCIFRGLRGREFIVFCAVARLIPSTQRSIVGACVALTLPTPF